MSYTTPPAAPEDRPRYHTRPRVSVVIATYNWSSVLRYAIQSVLWQTHEDLEVLVIGDGCTDDSAEVVASFNDARLRWHNLPRNSGSQSQPNNVGIALACGDFIAYLGHDDIWHPTHLERLVDVIQRNESDVAYACAVMLGPPGSNIRVLTGVFASGRYERLQGIPPSSIMHRKTLVDDIGPWRDFREMALPPDAEFIVRAHDAGKRFASSDALTVFKFNSAWRPNSYLHKPCDEQAEYIRRIQTEPEFLHHELLAIAKVHSLRLPMRFPEMPKAPKPLPAGWLVHQWRRLRGLEPLSQDAPRRTRGQSAPW